MSISKEKLLSIGSLALSEVLEKMDDKQLEEYCRELTDFIESFPTQETALKEAFAAKDSKAFAQTLLGLGKTLKRIHAVGLELSCRRLLTEFGAEKYTIAEPHMIYLIAEITGLSIEIQMAQRDGEPLKPEETKEEVVEAAPTLKVEVRQKSILAVDDVSFLLSGLKSILQNTGYKFFGVTSGEAALRYTDKFSPDLFLLDIEMPEMNGYELAKRLKMSGQKAPIVFLTGNASREYVRKALEVGAVDFIVKPVSKEHVLEKIRKHIGD